MATNLALAEVQHAVACPKSVALVSMTIVSGTSQGRRAIVTLDIDGRHKTEQLTVENGGPVHAAIEVIKILVPHQLEFLACCTKSMGKGSDAVARATIQVRPRGRDLIRGVDSDTDTVVASVKAYIVALNRHLASAQT